MMKMICFINGGKEEESDDNDLVVSMLIIADAKERNPMKLRRGLVPGRQVVPLGKGQMR
jgi:hypothetical protein